jgi:Ca-activated chloride channel family protein
MFFWLLFLLPILIVLFFLALYQKQKALRKIGDPELVSQLTAGYSSKKYLLKCLLAFAAWGLIVVALANWRKPVGEEKITRNGIDLMIALDVSKSMLAEDISPNRLERAKQLIGKIIDKAGSNRVGLVTFAGKAYLQMPLNGDLAAAKMYLSASNTNTVPTQGTVIADALRMCNAAFNPNEKKYKAVLLISDGEDHDKSATLVAEQMAANGVVIHCIGIGSSEGVNLPEEGGGYQKDTDGNIIISKLNAAALSEIARSTNGQYLTFQQTDEAVKLITGAISTMDQRSVNDEGMMNFTQYFQWFLWASLLFLLLEFFISENKKHNKLLMPLQFILLIGLLLCTNATKAQEDKKLIQKGNDQYRKGNYSEALTEYKDALKKNAANAIAQYNSGNAAYKLNRSDEAISAYDEALKNLKNPKDLANAAYNKAVVLQNKKDLKGCIEAYKLALKTDPSHEDARQNLQQALIQQKKEQKQEEQQKESDKQKKEPKKPEPRLSKQDAENKLKALMQREKELQEKLHKMGRNNIDKPEKDW